MPATHCTHAATEVEPVLGLAVPAPHYVHEVDAASEYVPAMQETHVAIDVAPNADDAVPAAQLVHEPADAALQVVAPH